MEREGEGLERGGEGEGRGEVRRRVEGDEEERTGPGRGWRREERGGEGVDRGEEVRWTGRREGQDVCLGGK